jgi:hypothetical protein
MNCQASQFSVMNCMKKVSQVKAEPTVKSRKFRSVGTLLNGLGIPISPAIDQLVSFEPKLNPA